MTVGYGVRILRMEVAMGKMGKIISMFLVCGIVGVLHPQCAGFCRADTVTEKNMGVESEYTFDEKTGTLTFYGQGMLGCKEGLLYEDFDYQHYTRGYYNDTERFKVSFDKIRKVVIGDEITGIYESFFQSMKWIEEVEIGAKVADIQQYAFMHCPAIRQITLSPANPYLKIVNRGLYSADGKTLYLYPPACDEQETVIASGTQKVCAGAFAYSHLKKITIPASITALSEGMFRDCAQLEEVIFAKGSKCKQTKYSGTAGGSFEGCAKLKRLEFGEKFQWITPRAFEKCTSLKSIYLGKSFQGFLPYGNYKKKTFECTPYDDSSDGIIFPALEKIRISGKNKVYQTKNNVVFSKNGKKLYYYPIARKGKSYKVPNSVKEIVYYAFYENQNLQFVHTGKNTTTIGSDAFGYAAKLSRVEFGKKLRTLEEGAFGGCSKLKSIKNLDRVTRLERDPLSGSQVYLILWDDSQYDTQGQPGKTMTFYLPKSYRGKDVQWSVISGKKYVKIAKRYAVGNKVTVKINQSANPKKAGKVTKSKVQAKVGKKKFFCEIVCNTWS